MFAYLSPLGVSVKNRGCFQKFINCKLYYNLWRMSNNLAKWSGEEDQLLREGVRKFGIKWELVKSYMKNVRSINSIIKRWHGKIKYETDMKIVRESTGRFPKILPENPSCFKKEPEIIPDEPDDNAWIWNKNWNERDDKKLKLLVIQSGIMSWELLSDALEASADEIKLRWKKVVYPRMIRQTSKVGGSLKWSILEDKILNIGYKQGVSWEGDGRIFLPQRSMGSIETRWRRVAKNFEVKSTMQNKYLARKECLKRIARMRRETAEVQSKNEGELNKFSAQ